MTSLISLLKLPVILDLDSPEASLAHRNIILSKPLLKQIYLKWYADIMKGFGNDSKVLEIGSGGGFIKNEYPFVMTSDIKNLQNCDYVVNAAKIPFENRSLDGIVMVNVFHHIPDCERFLNEAQRVLRKDGKLVMVEPANCKYSSLVYKRLHHEPFEPKQKGWKFESSGPLSDSNIALPYIVFERDKKIFKKRFKNLHINNIRYHTSLAYLLSGGLSFHSIVPNIFNSLLLKLDKFISFKDSSMFCTIEIEKM